MGSAILAVGIPGETTSTTSVSGAVAVFMGIGSRPLSHRSPSFFGPSVFKPATNAVNTHCAGSLDDGATSTATGLAIWPFASDYYDFHTQVAAATVLFGSASGLSTQGKVRIELEHMTATNHQNGSIGAERRRISTRMGSSTSWPARRRPVLADCARSGASISCRQAATDRT
jgi:hypothetical protein